MRYGDIELALKLYNYDEYKEYAKKCWVPENEIWKKDKFEGNKELARQKIYEIHTQYLKSWETTPFWKYILRGHFETLTKIWGTMLHFVLLPVFFSAAHKNWQDIGSLFESWFETYAFIKWSKIWWELPLPLLLKMVAWILTWAWAVVGWKYFWEHVL